MQLQAVERLDSKFQGLVTFNAEQQEPDPLKLSPNVDTPCGSPPEVSEYQDDIIPCLTLNTQTTPLEARIKVPEG